MGIFERLKTELAEQEKADGLSMADVLLLPEQQSQLVGWLIRKKQVTIDAVVDYLDTPKDEALSIIAELVEKSFVREMEIEDVTHYKIRFAPKRGKELPLNVWDALTDKITDESE